MTRVLIATPCRDAATIPYLNALWALAKLKTSAYEFVPAISRSCYVSFARNAFVEKARAEQCEEIVFIDADTAWDTDKLLRLLSHGVDIVGGVYCKRKPGEPEWTAHSTLEGCREDGLQPVNDIGTGFLRVKMSVFDTLDLRFPHRRFTDNGKTRMEYFPMGLCAGTSHMHPAELTLRRVLEAITGDSAESDPLTAIRRVKAAILNETGPVSLVGEDIGFCRLCRAAGIPLYADTRLRLRHMGEIGFPAKELPL